MIKVRIQLVLIVDEKEYNAEYGSDDSREDIIDDIETRVLGAVDHHFTPFSFVTDSFIEENN